MLKGKSILLGVSGGIAAYKSATLASLLKKQHADVTVVMTENATEFIGPATFDAITGNRTIVETFDRNHEFSTEHVSLSNKTDLVIVAPATANIIAKLVHGIADDMLTTTILACDCPKLIAPAMNTKMWTNEITQTNLRTARKFGFEIIGPDSGKLACGDSGKGRMTEPEEILEYIVNSISAPQDMVGLSVLVSAGPTRENIDPVRFITNNSTGKMGYALARAASSRGARVTLVTGPTSLPKPYLTENIDVVSAQEMYNEITDKFEENDILIMAAAVADYTPAYVSDNKIKKSESSIDLSLNKTKDILKAISELKEDDQIVCGFAMETENLVENAKKKLVEKNLDVIVANSVSDKDSGFASDSNMITVITTDKTEELPLMSKTRCAHKILDEILNLYEPE